MKWAYLGVAAVVAYGATGPGLAGVSERSPGVEVRYTAYGVAHVASDTYEGAGFGYGNVLAKDNLCVVAERAITLAGERSRALSASATYYDAQSFGEISNLDSDAVYQYVLSPDLLERTKRGASQEVAQLVRGYVRGFNRHARGAALPGETCRKEAWFRPLTEDDVWRRIAQTPLLETTARVLRQVIAAAPPRAGDVPATAALDLAELADRRGASNAIAFGKDGVEGGIGGMNFANPHYVWHGSERLHAMHLNVRGKLNVFGATLYGLPFPLMGFTDHVGWAITQATDKRSTLYRLDLDPADPTRYRVDGQVEPMRRVGIKVMTQQGPVERSFWETRYGPVVENENLPWDGAHAYALADPERGNNRFANQFLAMARAKTVREINAALHTFQGVPWSNVTAADRDGEVFYSNISVAANITDAQLQRCVVLGPAHTYMLNADFTTLNGSDGGCAWTKASGTPQPGIIPASRRPSMIRSDVLFNANDSYWYVTLAPDARIEGLQKVIGPERTMRAERTRVSALYARDAMQGSLLTGTPGATPAKWETLFFNARNLTAELVLDDLLADCLSNTIVAMPDGSKVDVSTGCEALRGWDRRDTSASRGSAFFVEVARNIAALMATPDAAERIWRVPFDANDPVGTPRGLVMSDAVRQAFARAVVKFREADLALDGALRDQQAVTRNGVRLPVSGSLYTYHRIAPGAYEPGKGATDIRAGDSYIHVVAIRPDGVSGRFLVTYSQSTNPVSPHFSDMTALFSEGKLADISFSEESIRKAQVGDTIRFDRRDLAGRR